MEGGSYIYEKLNNSLYSPEEPIQQHFLIRRWRVNSPFQSRLSLQDIILQRRLLRSSPGFPLNYTLQLGDLHDLLQTRGHQSRSLCICQQVCWVTCREQDNNIKIVFLIIVFFILSLLLFLHYLLIPQHALITELILSKY